MAFDYIVEDDCVSSLVVVPKIGLHLVWLESLREKIDFVHVVDQIQVVAVVIVSLANACDPVEILWQTHLGIVDLVGISYLDIVHA